MKTKDEMVLKKIAQYEEQAATLFHFAFGIDIDSDDILKKNRCAEKAYLDMCRTMKYKEGKKKEIEEFKNEVAREIINSIEVYPVVKNKTECEGNFDGWHESLCESIKLIGKKYDIFSVEEPVKITYGQCQKWINMTIKYMHIMGVLPDQIELKDIHIPIDNYILKATSQEGEILKEVEGIERVLINKPYKLPWSKNDCYEEYLDFQKKIREIFKNKEESAVEWENKAWLAMAVYESNKNELKQ